MRMKPLILAGMAMVMGGAWTAQAVDIAIWDTMTVTNPLAGSFAPSGTHVNVSASNLVASTNLALNGSGPAANTFAAGGYASTSSNEAMTSNHYWETVIQADPGYAVSFTNVRTKMRSSSSGPKTQQWAYSTNGIDFTWLLPTNVISDNYNNNRIVLLSGIPALQNQTGPVWFRVYAWGGGSAANSWGVFGKTNVLHFSGTVTSGPPVITFNPSGNQSIAVSNLLSLAVGINPTGSGMKSWTFLPSNYAGTASLSGGTFQFTPAGPDNGSNYTLSVVGTNTMGTRTGSVTVTVTPYEPPVPVITFSPTGTYSIMATSTQKLGIGLSPAGSVIASWTLLPSNYVGPVSVVGTNFTFVPAQADGPSNYTFTVIASNVFGSKTGSVDIAVTAYVPPPPPGAYICTFEDGTKTGYASGDVTLSNVVWNLTGILIGDSSSDLKIGIKSARLQYNPADGEETMTSQQALLTNGIASISLWYGPYGNHGTNAPQMVLEVSDSLTGSWLEVGAFDAAAVSNLTYYATDVYVGEPVYVRIRAVNGVSGKSANLDNITIAPYTAPSNSAYDAYLLQYNVTPGDPGTATNENLDGDAFSNQDEYLGGTNPYDDASHP